MKDNSFTHIEKGMVLCMCQKKEDMNIVIVGHVDHGKSTLIGRMLADTNSLPEGKLAMVRETCRRNSKPFEYAFLLDALKDEQAQGITIDTARCFFKTEKRNYIILDAPGHIEFLKNMITGAARAEAALLVIDAKEGVQENSKRHGYMLSMLGIKKIVVVINKMDLVDYQQDAFERVKKEYLNFLGKLSLEPMDVIPISAFEGDNVAIRSKNMEWYQGITVLEALDAFPCEREKEEQPFRMPVQDVYKFTKNGDDRRIVAGTVESGSIGEGEEVVFYPSGKRSRIKTIEAFPVSKTNRVTSGMAVGFTLEEQIYITRGEIMTKDGQEKPWVASQIRANVFWLGRQEMTQDKKYYLKLGSEKVKVRLLKVLSVMNSSNLDVAEKEYIGLNEVAECILETDKPIGFDDVTQIAKTSRFVLIDDYEIYGGGIVLAPVEDGRADIRSKILLRNYKWEHSEISMEKRAECYSQKPILLIITGNKGAGKKDLAKGLEKYLVERGRFAYYLGIGTFLYGVDSDIKKVGMDEQEEHIRRFGEVANLMLDAGLILIVTARDLKQRNLNILTETISADIEVVWTGESITTDIHCQIKTGNMKEEEAVYQIKERLGEKGYIFRF